MSFILSVGTCTPPYRFEQNQALEFARDLFSDRFRNIERLLKVFENAEIDTRYFSRPLTWFKEDHTFQEKNDLYIELALELSEKAVKKCLDNKAFLKDNVPIDSIDAIFFVSSTGFSTPSIEARLMNVLPFSPYTKRIPIWGLGCAGGASGLSRAHDYCKAYPQQNVLIISVELCSLTFQRNDFSKSNLVGTSLFADGVACALVIGEESGLRKYQQKTYLPEIQSTMSTLKPDSENVMGWEVKNSGLFVVFSKDIPTIIQNWLEPNVSRFLDAAGVKEKELDYFIAHPGGKKVLDAYKAALDFSDEKTKISREVLREYGNMSSATVFFVLEKFLALKEVKGTKGLLAALGPGFSSELLLLEWS
ncbi:type III polyketide synthase [Pseudalkalibacillus caeni]|uniref:Type III polyketide synthase n=1 Tax=Exobacillus caeni TaxID=2574798 RepID=A0A5R9EX45_9BACL|nr:3-oxoacyl-[acyl-carrier-protein] synthase III C-terminal domain-containing protein [Pseudalkalibacillus caeni]TLS35637.1 type III polyketide synthase [Pseudalkalibacillus caeni]